MRILIIAAILAALTAGMAYYLRIAEIERLDAMPTTILEFDHATEAAD